MRVFILLVMMVAQANAGAADLRIHGSNTVGASLMPALVEQWLRQEGCSQTSRDQKAPEEILIQCAVDQTGKPISVELHAHGTGTGFAGLIAGAADIAMASRPVNSKEQQGAAGKNLGALDDAAQEHVLALDGIAIVVAATQTVRELSLEQVRDIFAGRIRNWEQLGGENLAIELHARDEKSGTFDTFQSLVLGEAALANAVRYEDSDLLVKTVSARPGAIGFSGLSSIKNATVIKIGRGAGAMAPTQMLVATEDYPLARRLYLYASASPTPLAQSLLAFALSDAAQTDVDRAGFVSMRIQPVRGSVASDASAAYRDQIDGHVRLSLNFRFGSGSALLDSRAEQDLARIRDYMLSPDRRKSTVRLLGFSDRSAQLPYADLMISIDRADYLAMRLAHLGVRVERVRGFGGELPVASNDVEAGRARNRRVEIWVPAAASSGAGQASSP